MGDSKGIVVVIKIGRREFLNKSGLSFSEEMGGFLLCSALSTFCSGGNISWLFYESIRRESLGALSIKQKAHLG
jgi:hypothetical protein